MRLSSRKLYKYLGAVEYPEVSDTCSVNLQYAVRKNGIVVSMK